MPTTVTALLILALAVLPGKIGSFFFEQLSGRDWRERDWNAALRLVGFSVVGLACYAQLGQWFHWPPPKHVVPAEYSQFSADSISALAGPLFGHILGSILVGIAAGYGMRFLEVLFGVAARPCAWDTFASDCVQGRWVVLTLKSGDAYAGYIAVADTGVASSDRDIVLREPARLQKSDGEYRAVGYRDLFIPAALVDSVATIRDDRDEDAVATSVGEPLFAGVVDEGKVWSVDTSAAAFNNGSHQTWWRDSQASHSPAEDTCTTTADNPSK